MYLVYSMHDESPPMYKSVLLRLPHISYTNPNPEGGGDAGLTSEFQVRRLKWDRTVTSFEGVGETYVKAGFVTKVYIFYTSEHQIEMMIYPTKLRVVTISK